MGSHLSKTVSSCFNHLRKLKWIRCSVPHYAIRALVSSLVSSFWTIRMSYWWARGRGRSIGFKRYWMFRLDWFFCGFRAFVIPVSLNAARLDWDQLDFALRQCLSVIEFITSMASVNLQMLDHQRLTIYLRTLDSHPHLKHSRLNLKQIFLFRVIRSQIILLNCVLWDYLFLFIGLCKAP